MRNLIIILFSIVTLVSCNTKPSLQKYFVDNTESKDFVAIDLGSDIINTEKMSLTASDKEALKSFEKMNVLAFKKEESNKSNYDVEVQKVKTILKDTTSYNELMKFGSGNDGASIYFVGDDDHINEFVLFANKKENGFAVVRILGKDMNPMHIMKIIGLIQKSNINLDQLKPLQDIMK
ncbi:DUF4252 domain-containing protein [uncultured Flavobacterium sp.]|uniref:DUF4252 domain-containing protein n=1 Tax=uncultured Flavobacterium sp. TaxID=165435 RepID=UPI0030EEA44B|tara:strand:- start:32729 stop:33262 length:534 start_codon:yes stop_codon:yes gene_type:complete